MTSNLSRKHHYLPQYYLKGFTDKNNLFYLYKKGKETIEKNQYNTNSLFYENNRNTINFKGENSVIIEDLYADFDNIFSKLFHDIENGLSEEALFSDNNIALIKQFVALFIMRLPVIDEQIEDIIDIIDITKTRNTITVAGKNIFTQDDIRKKLKTDKNFRYYFRCFVLPVLLFDFQGKDEGRWYIFETERSGHNHLCGDNPILIGGYDFNKLISFNLDFIIPLSNKKLLVHSMNKNLQPEKLPLPFLPFVDLLILWKSQKYVVGSEKNYLEKILDQQKDITKQGISYNMINERLFSYLR